MKNLIIFIVVILVIWGGFSLIPQDKPVVEAPETNTTENTQVETHTEEEEKLLSEEVGGEMEGITTEEKEEIEKSTVVSTAGTYEVYAPEKLAKAASGDVVLFFRASWCPSCRALDADIKKNLSKIPADLTILDVDYDKYSVLKQKYGVTYQHTMVQVDKDGNQIAKWSGSPTLTDLASKVK